MSQSTPDILVGASLAGGTGIQAIEDAMKANGSCHSGAIAPSYKVIGTPWWDSANALKKVWDGSIWRVVNGYNVVDPIDVIGDWIAASVVTYTDVDVSDDGVPTGAVAADIMFRSNSTVTAANLYVRKKGSVDTAGIVAIGKGDSYSWPSTFMVPLDSDGKFQARFSADWSGSMALNNAYVRGYWY